MKAGQGHIPVRTCIGCRAKGAQPSLVRIAAVDGRVAVDRRRRLPGRGAYVHPRSECVERVERRGIVQRALKTRIDAADVAALIRALHSEAGQR